MSVMLAFYDAHVRALPDPLPAGVTAEHDGPLVRLLGGHRGFVAAPADLRVDGADLDRLIARQRDRFAGLGQAVEWKTHGHDLPADLTGRLRAAGFEPEEEETVMIAPAEDVAAEPVPPEGVVLRRVEERADLERIAAFQGRVWGDDRSWVADDLAAQLAANPRGTVVLVAEAGEEVVCAARLEARPEEGHAGLWGGSTLPEWRGRGIYRATVAERARLAVAMGVRYLQVDASPDSAPILRRLGFTAVTTTTPYVWTPPAADGR
ncbi:GNAT family N-acetyltransferase [Nocardiopsis sp. MT53]|uniref:GNAT family N-acetyltransferase n=2 Tax=Nocardiopsidaceae TaxID=83676 RepID=A0ABX8BTU3_9ACTN|nr:GNAT family N-acetyltransferase [Nocardiopsis changdeensis]QYX40144.1 GNAT family N-acetyltransferase [Nocardiopsis sp. MT53]